VIQKGHLLIKEYLKKKLVKLKLLVGIKVNEVYSQHSSFLKSDLINIKKNKYKIII
jgi:hypothetical protein